MRSNQVVGSRPLLPGEIHVRPGFVVTDEKFKEALVIGKLALLTLVIAFAAMVVWNHVYIKPHDKMLEDTYGSVAVSQR